MTSTHHDRRPPRRPLVVTALLLALCGGVSIAQPAHDDDAPPTILVLPPAEFDANAPLIVRARLVDPAGIGEALVHARGDAPGDVYRPFPMRAEGDDVWVATIPTWAGRGQSVGFYVEAVDELGNGPRRSGTPDEPFLAQSANGVAADAERAAATPTALGGGSVPWLWIGVVVLLAGGLVPVCLRLAHRRVEREFWIDILAPMAYEDGGDLLSAIDELCSTMQHHPYRGATHLETTEIVTWLDRLRESEPRRLRQAWLERRRQRAESTRRRPSRDQCGFEEEMFWCQVLAPLVDLTDAQSAPALEALAGCPLDHPHEGRRTYPRTELRRRLNWVRQHGTDAILRHLDEIAITADDDAATSTEPRVRQAVSQAGFSAAELLASLAIAGALATIGALSVSGFADPLGTSEQLVSGTLKQARSRAMAATVAQRVRPVDAQTLVVESGTGCGSSTWIVDPRMNIQLPDEVAIVWTGWSICFDSRGIADDSYEFVIRHDDGRTRRLEVLRGGTVRRVS